MEHTPEAPTGPVLVITRRHLPMLWSVAWKNIRLRYKSSLLGFFWTLFNPLLFLLIFLFIFSTAFPQVANYPVFALTGLIFWSFFATTSGHILGSLVENAPVLRSMAVPPLVFPVSQLMAGLFNLLASLLPFAAILWYFGWRPVPATLLVFPVVALFAAFLFGVSLALCALNVFFRDIGLLWSALLPALFYLTPVAYPPDLVPERLHWVAQLNPLYHFTGLAREVLYAGRMPGLDQWVTALGLALIALLAGLSIFNLLRRGFIANY
jgi:ABC-type polysaccharide/polyol phosphate export permease